MKKEKRKGSLLVNATDAPGIKGTDSIFLIPLLEVVMWPNKAELTKYFRKLHPHAKEYDNLWGFVYGNRQERTLEIHIRSVRSHGNKDEFYHTLGHELSHILERMEKTSPVKEYNKARFYRMLDDVKEICRYCWYKAGLGGTLARKASQILQKYKQMVSRLHSQK